MCNRDVKLCHKELEENDLTIRRQDNCLASPEIEVEIFRLSAAKIGSAVDQLTDSGYSEV